MENVGCNTVILFNIYTKTTHLVASKRILDNKEVNVCIYATNEGCYSDFNGVTENIRKGITRLSLVMNKLSVD